MEHKKRVFTVLAIEGGGVRGIMPARILQELEERTGKPVSELFDLVGGVSTGAILASGLTVPDADDPKKPRFSAQEMKNFYHRYAPRIFPSLRFKGLQQVSGKALYDPAPMEAAFQKNFGDARVGDSLTHLMIPATDIRNFRPAWIRCIRGEKDASPEKWTTMLLRDAIRAATTAPTYFPAKYVTTTPDESMPNVTQRHALIDGQFLAGNMLRRLYGQAKKIAPPDAEIVVVHLGTGNVENHLTPEEFNKLGTLGLVGKAQGAILLSLVFNLAAADTADDLREEIGDRLISFDGFIDTQAAAAPATSLDDSTPENMKKIEHFAEKILQDNAPAVDRLCTILRQRLYAEECHKESAAAFNAVSDLLAEKQTVRAVAQLYDKVLRYSTDIDDPVIPGDEDLQAACASLTPGHKEDLDRFYRALIDRRRTENQTIGKLRETAGDLSKAARRFFNLPPRPPAPPQAPPAAPKP